MTDEMLEGIAKLLKSEEDENIELVRAMDISLSKEQLKTLEEKVFKLFLAPTLEFYLKDATFSFFLLNLKEGTKYRCRVNFNSKTMWCDTWCGVNNISFGSIYEFDSKLDLYEKFKDWLRENNRIKFNSDFRSLFEVYESKEAINKEIDSLVSEIEKNKLDRKKQRLND